jgi:hypothetical protein
VDATYAVSRAAEVGVNGTLTEDGQVFRVSHGDRLVIVRKATGGSSSTTAPSEAK